MVMVDAAERIGVGSSDGDGTAGGGVELEASRGMLYTSSSQHVSSLTSAYAHVKTSWSNESQWAHEQ